VETATVASEFDAPFDRIFRGHSSAHRHLRGQRCRIVARGSSNLAVLVEFQDGERAVTWIRSLRWDNGT
jgi:hypothetical protein